MPALSQKLAITSSGLQFDWLPQSRCARIMANSPTLLISRFLSMFLILTGAIFLVEEHEDEDYGFITLPYEFLPLPEVGDLG